MTVPNGTPRPNYPPDQPRPTTGPGRAMTGPGGDVTPDPGGPRPDPRPNIPARTLAAANIAAFYAGLTQAVSEPGGVQLGHRLVSVSVSAPFGPDDDAQWGYSAVAS